MYSNLNHIRLIKKIELPIIYLILFRYGFHTDYTWWWYILVSDKPSSSFTKNNRPHLRHIFPTHNIPIGAHTTHDVLARLYQSAPAIFNTYELATLTISTFYTAYTFSVYESLNSHLRRVSIWWEKVWVPLMVGPFTFKPRIALPGSDLNMPFILCPRFS